MIKLLWFYYTTAIKKKIYIYVYVDDITIESKDFVLLLLKWFFSFGIIFWFSEQ
jgi:hypothetical protein